MTSCGVFQKIVQLTNDVNRLCFKVGSKLNLFAYYVLCHKLLTVNAMALFAQISIFLCIGFMSTTGATYLSRLYDDVIDISCSVCVFQVHPVFNYICSI